MGNNIAKALLKAQMEMGVAIKGASNPFFKKKYADLNSIREACMPALNKNGISVLQPTVHIDGKNFVKTVLLHESGETFESLTEILFVKANDPQAQGSGISYARRYGLQSLVNVGADDDDGNEASGKIQEAKAIIPVNHEVKKDNQKFAKELSEIRPETHSPVIVVEESEEEKAAKFLAKKLYKDNSKKSRNLHEEVIDVDAEKISMYAIEAAKFIKTLKTKQGVKEAVKPRADLLRTKEGITEKDIEYFKIECTNYYNSLTN